MGIRCMLPGLGDAPTCQVHLHLVLDLRNATRSKGYFRFGGCPWVESCWKQQSAPKEANPVREAELDSASHEMLAGHAVVPSWLFQQLGYPTGHP